MTFAMKQRPRSWWYPCIIVGGMVIVIIVNGLLAFFALDSWTGIETENHYTKGLNFDSNINGAKRQQMLGWTLQPHFDYAPIGLDKTRPANLTVTAKDHTGTPLDTLTIRVQLIRPTHEGFDQTVPLTLLGDGVYGGDVVLPLPGQWEVRILAQHGEDAFQMQQRIQTP